MRAETVKPSCWLSAVSYGESQDNDFHYPDMTPPWNSDLRGDWYFGIILINAADACDDEDHN
jgi:hypothetical protein